MKGTVTTRSGRVLTEADIDRLADQAEAGFDISTWTTRPGRPPLTVGGQHSPRIAVRVPEDLRQRAMARAATEGRTISEVVRDLLEAYARQPAKPRHGQR
jgi:hypothetical protein